MFRLGENDAVQILTTISEYIVDLGSTVGGTTYYSLKDNDIKQVQFVGICEIHA